MSDDGPEILIISRPNGAGRSSCAARYLPEGMVFLNADEVAKGLPGYPSPSVDIQAGRIILEQMDELEGRAESFAVETTLATRSLAVRINRLRSNGYRFHLVYVWSPSADFSVQRVASRVRSGGHHIPEPTIRRRYSAGMSNFFGLYQPIADVWDVLDNTRPDGPFLIASGRSGYPAEITTPRSGTCFAKGEPMSYIESHLREPRTLEGPAMIAAMKRGVIEAIREHKREGRSIVTWDRESRRIVEEPPDEISVRDQDEDLDSNSISSK